MRGRAWPRTNFESVDSEFFSALVLRPALLDGFPAKPCKSRRDSPPDCHSPVIQVAKDRRMPVFCYLLRGRDLHPRPPGYEPGELLLLHPAMKCVVYLTRKCEANLDESEFLEDASVLTDDDILLALGERIF